MMTKFCGVCKIAWLLVIVGAINWGLVGAFQFNLVYTLLGSWPVVERIVYVLVGLSGLLAILSMMGKCKKCCQVGGAACKGGECKGGECKGEGEAKQS